VQSEKEKKKIIIKHGTLVFDLLKLRLSLLEILATHLDESLTHHFQLGLTKVFKFYIFSMVGLTEVLGNVFWIYQNKLLQVSISLVYKHVLIICLILQMYFFKISIYQLLVTLSFIIHTLKLSTHQLTEKSSYLCITHRSF